MKEPPDSRLQQKTANFLKALRALERSVATPIMEPRDLSGIIKDFEITYELCWKSLKTFLEKEGHETGSAKNVFSQSYQLWHLAEESVWLEMITDRNLTVHTYDEELAKTLCDHIRANYLQAFQTVEKLLKESQ